mmetsp:Transcript_62681/g.161301  ORF Transcript_62681/g.161301 Transcript_62681/m.161301 type:complete len:429 (-) Transcript_62681:75-1361(-)|eukprot:CAMPEP_0195134736 /NCGR_PEP_ID=MMETSP0448-20130528/151179_1 /TAXON_ID=66468 /ORGANISM="Heterocapsa triquestra, Strain CCMP 448" /LENGTH=428 /DNA_ID=CAMNT_0040172837 /DNA_START=63 /DNA_END=1349 /DNA_ORIENTATION=+
MAISKRGPRFVAQGPREGPHRRPRGSRTLGGLLLAVLACWLWVQTPTVTPGSTTAFVSSGFLKQALIPFSSLCIGAVLYAMNGGGSKANETAAIVMIYFGAQTGMNLYMKSVLSQIVVDEEEGLKGIPIGFLLTALQQFVAFLAFCLFLFGGKIIGSNYQVKPLTKRSDILAVILFSMTFALNIGLNNFSLSLVAISVNLIIRSCLPLSTALSQTVVSKIMGGNQKPIPLDEWVLMLLGVGCAAVATICKSSGSSGEDGAPMLGIACCVASIFSGALNMVLAGVLGNTMKLNPVDTTAYMALPAGLVLLLASLLVYHPMGKWPGFPAMTDWEVLVEVMGRNPQAIIPVLFSGVLSFIYNIMVYTMVHKLSAGFASFAGNFNKAATVALSLLLGLESLPSGNYGYLFIASVVGNIAVFTAYSARATGAK